MNEKEKDVQEALGLLKTYCGYVKLNASNASDKYYEIYEVQDVTVKGARKQLDEIVEKVQKKSKVSRKLKFVVDKMENPYAGGKPCSNPKS